MLLHEAVQKARTDLGLSQKKLAELAGIQRKQLATLEKGGNITLATLRKILAHLPNLETFNFDVATATVRRNVPPAEAVQTIQSAVGQLGETMRVLFTKVAAGQDLDETDADSLRNISDTFKRGYGWTEEDIQRDHEQEERELDAQVQAEQALYRRGVEDGFRTMAQMNSRRMKRARLALKAAREG